MGYRKTEAVMVGDSYGEDYQGALNAGISAVLVNRTRKEYKKEVVQGPDLYQLLQTGDFSA